MRRSYSLWKVWYMDEKEKTGMKIYIVLQVSGGIVEKFLEENKNNSKTP